jgi:hypothetical protein
MPEDKIHAREINSLRIAAQGWPSFELKARMKELIDRKLRDNGNVGYRAGTHAGSRIAPPTSPFSKG